MLGGSDRCLEEASTVKRSKAIYSRSCKLPYAAHVLGFDRVQLGRARGRVGERQPGVAEAMPQHVVLKTLVQHGPAGMPPDCKLQLARDGT